MTILTLQITIRMVAKEKFIPILSKIGYKTRKKLSTFLNIKNVSDAFSGNFITDERFEQLLEFMELQKVTNFSFVGSVVENDDAQKSHFLRELNNLFNSSDMKDYDQNKQGLLLQEQIRMYKDINNNKYN